MPVAKRTEPTKSIRVKAGDSILLSIIIGNAQIGSSSVKFKYNSTILAKGEINDLLIGTGADIRGKTLRVATRVLDANTATNKVVITHRFDNGTPADSVYEDEIPEGQDVFTLLVDYNFE
jgi:beta-lactam-binding protein with PASTA domain